MSTQPQTLLRRDAHFVEYADAYRHRIEVLQAENRKFGQVINRWPSSESARVLRRRVAANRAEIKKLSGKVNRIMANVRR